MSPAGEEAGTAGVGVTPGAAAPLQAAAAVGATLSKDVHVVEWNGQVSENSFHLFVNETDEALELSWGDELRDTYHSAVAARANVFVGTYVFHTWRVRSASRGLIATYTGPSVVLTVTPDGYHTHTNTNSRPTHPQTATATSGPASGTADKTAATTTTASTTGTAAGGGGEGEYQQRSTVLGMPIWAFESVSDAAVSRLCAVVGCMLAASPPELVARLVQGGGSFAIFGVEQVVSDVPAHRFMRYNTGRDLDASARGLGATPTVPVTSCGEENLTMQGDRWYPCQSILVHEMGHMVHNMGLPAGGPNGVAGVLEAYRAAVQDRLYPPDCYMVVNEQEYWAVGVESWFESTVRDDVNGGIKTRAALRSHDPRLATLLEAAFGDGAWRYWQDCPRPLAMPTRGSAAPTRKSASAGGPATAPRGSVAVSIGIAAAQVPAPTLSATPSYRSRRPPKLTVDDSCVNAGGNGGMSPGVALLLRRLLCRRFMSIRRRRQHQHHQQRKRQEQEVQGPPTMQQVTETPVPPPQPQQLTQQPTNMTGPEARRGAVGAAAAPASASNNSTSIIAPDAAHTSHQAQLKQPSYFHIPPPLPQPVGHDAPAVAEGVVCPYLPPPLPQPVARRSTACKRPADTCQRNAVAGAGIASVRTEVTMDGMGSKEAQGYFGIPPPLPQPVLDAAPPKPRPSTAPAPAVSTHDTATVAAVMPCAVMSPAASIAATAVGSAGAGAAHTAINR